MKAVNYDETDVLCSENLAFPHVRIFSNKDSIVKFYTFRYWMVRSLTTSPTFLPHWITFRKSALELFLIIAMFAITLAISQGWLNGRTSGELAEDMACFMIISAFKNNALTIFLGVSWERAIQVHKVAGVLTVLLSISHMIINMRERLRIVKYGIALLCLFTASSLSYLLKKRHYEVFYAFHIASYFCILGVGFMHGADMLVYTIIVWGVDWLARIYFGLHKVEANVTALSNNVVKISFKRNFKYFPGQFCLVAIPSLSYFQFHPFSISSAPHEEEVSFHIKTNGNWTKQLEKLACTAHEGAKSDLEIGEGKDNAMRVTSSDGKLMVTKKLNVVVEGPYGLPSIDLISGGYSVFLLIAGGIGVTPVQSIYLHLVNKYKTNPTFVKKCVLVWSVREEIFVSNFPNLLVTVPTVLTDDAMNESCKGEDVYSDLHHDIVSVVSASSQPVDSIEREHNPGGKKNKISHTEKRNIKSPEESILGDNSFHKIIYVTGASSTSNVSIYSDTQTTVSSGRPDYSQVFCQVASLCVQESHARVAVVTCGPIPLADNVERLCTYRHGGVAFDLHREIFEI